MWQVVSKSGCKVDSCLAVLFEALWSQHLLTPPLWLCSSSSKQTHFFTCTAVVPPLSFYQEQVEQKKLRGNTDIRPIFQSFSLFWKKDGVVVISSSSRRFEFLRQETQLKIICFVNKLKTSTIIKTIISVTLAR